MEEDDRRSRDEARDAKALRAPEQDPAIEGELQTPESGQTALRDSVPWIGRGSRWYDPPYRILMWLSRGWRQRVVPRRIRELLNRGVNYLIPFNEHQRQLASPDGTVFGDFSGPDGDAVEVPGLWMCELFPPSRFTALEAALGERAWDRRRQFIGSDTSNVEALRNSRRSAGAAWWRIADIANLDSGYLVPDGSREKLPAEFGLIQLKGVKIGSGLTAVVAQFHLSEIGRRALNDAWQREYAPTLIRAAGRPRAEDKQFTMYRETQSARSALHALAIRWMSRNLPGFFSLSDDRRPVVDMLLMKDYDPTADDRPPRRRVDGLRALGLTDFTVGYYRSEALPGLIVTPSSETLAPHLRSSDAWAIWGQQQAAESEIESLASYGGGAQGVANRYDDIAGHLVMTLTVSAYLRAMHGRLASLRDEAAKKHGRFTAGRLETLRTQLLTSSLDLSTVRHDLNDYWNRRHRMEGEVDIFYDFHPSMRLQDEREGYPPFEPVDMRRHWKKEQRSTLRRLRAADAEYRQILSTAASLGASADAFKTGRFALVVAFASLAIAAVTLAVTDPSQSSVMGWLWSQFSGLFN